MRSSAIVVMCLAGGTAHADPATSSALPQPPFLTLQPIPMFSDPLPVPSVTSLRLDAARAAAEVFENSWRYPDAAPAFSLDGDRWFFGHGMYAPRSSRAAALHGGSMAATLVGQILIGTGSPLAGVSAMVTGATLDAAAADVDRDAEARRSRE
jgi:hypothetical protein